MELFEHNRIAYESAAKMLEERGRAAVIHPTGTGKSFIAFRLCEEHPSSRICWLSPSEYIYRTQADNLVHAGGKVPENVVFYTYAKLMLLSDSELKDICPGHIVLDEFHRCGAEMWGQGVRRLLELFPKAKVLGLSATNIRYLDNCRDMADELFGGNVASRMTLGEAIVRGILGAPRYVLSAYRLDKDLRKYARKVRGAKNKVVREEAVKYYEALRRALEKADGLDKVFEKNIPDRTGKYIVFCSDYDHLTEMTEKVPEWFGGIDKEPHIYKAYSEDPETSKAFAAFKADESEHLKLLFCIDMLNEGVHVEGVSGVILLRPTVSPIIYKQQIGRALSAGKKKQTAIFDVVMNIENLYGIGTIEAEMRTAVSDYRARGLGDRIVNEWFEVVDEIGDCRTLFSKLDATLGASWEKMYELAKGYYEAHGNLEVPLHYKTEEGYSLGGWLFTQRKVRAGEEYGVLSEEQIKRLDEIGMIWSGYRDLIWERYFAAAKAYREKYGDLKVPAEYRMDTGLKLGSWLSNLRTYRKSGLRKNYLTEERISALDGLGMEWSVPDYLFERNYAAALEYWKEHGSLDVPAGQVSGDGVRLGNWIQKLRRIRKGAGEGRLTEEQVKRLDEIGMEWSDKYERLWEKGYREAERYYAANGDLKVPTGYVTDTGYKLGHWIADQRENKKLNAERRARLDALGMIWEKPDAWERKFELAKEYFLRNGNLNVPANYIAQGVWLNKWVNEQKQIYLGNRKGKVLTSEQIERLESVGMRWR